MSIYILPILYGLLYNFILIFVLLFTKHKNMFFKKRIKIRKWIYKQNDITIFLIALTIISLLFLIPFKGVCLC